MNKILNIFKYILLCILLYLIVTFLVKYLAFFSDFGLVSVTYLNEFNSLVLNLLPILLILLYTFFAIKDLIKKCNINNNLVYNVLSIIVIGIVSFIFIRILFDPNFLENFAIKNNFTDFIGDGLLYIEKYYLSNIIYILGLFGLLLVYRKINLK